jgi:hypothetical protein
VLPVKAPAKRGRGRPSLSGETGERYQVTIPPTIEEKIRRYGEGSLSGGIIKAAKLIKERK